MGPCFPRLHTLFLLVILSSCPVLATAQGSRGGARRGSSGGGRSPEMGGAGPRFLGGITSAHAEDERKVEFKSTTVLVQVPAVVTDKSGNHVHGLTKDDFQIFENGKQ